MSKTPLTDKEEKFIYYESFSASRDFWGTERSVRKREGYVSSEFEMARYVPVPDKPGFCKFDHMCTYREFGNALSTHIGNNGMTDFDYLHVGDVADISRARIDEEIPKGSGHYAVFLVEGSSEGYYLHVEFVDCNRAASLLVLIKTFSRESALKMLFLATVFVNGW